MKNDNIASFEAEMATIKRPGMDKLMEYICKSDFYTAPASTRYHLSYEGGLLQHSLNVLDALRGILRPSGLGNPDSWQGNGLPKAWDYVVAREVVDTIPNESVTLVALLHDLCKTYFYQVSTRNAKNEKTGKWEKVPFYTVNDRMPLGHGPKSAMLVKTYIQIDSREMYAIWWHMGFTDSSDTLSLTNALKAYPFIWAVHNADMMASYMMEDNGGNKAAFKSDTPPSDSENDPEFYEAPAYEVDE